MIDADQHEGAGCAEAARFLDRLGQRRHEMGAVELAGQRIVPRQFQELLVAGAALVVDADNALRAHRLAAGSGAPAPRFLAPQRRVRKLLCAPPGCPSDPANQQPVSSIHSTGAEIEVRTPYSIL